MEKYWIFRQSTCSLSHILRKKNAKQVRSAEQHTVPAVLWRAFFLTKTMIHISYYDFGPGGATWRSWTTPPHRATGKYDMYDDFILQSNNHVNFPFSEVNQVILGNNKRELAIASAFRWPDSCTSDIQVTVLLLVGCFIYIYIYGYIIYIYMWIHPPWNIPIISP